MTAVAVRATSVGLVWLGGARLLWQDVKRRWYWFLGIPAILLALSFRYELGVNITPSLPYTLVVIDKDAAPKRGDLIVYRFRGEALAGYRPGMRFFKRVLGMPGDAVTVEGRSVFVAGNPVGFAKRRTREGIALDVVAPQAVQPSHFYVAGDGENSFDSRYRQSGFVHASQVVGVAWVIF